MSNDRNRTERHTFGVDSGHIFIGDPCYFLPRKADKDKGLDYDDLLKLEEKAGYPSAGKAQLESGGDVVFSGTGYGDGEYTAVIEYRNNRPMRITIDFDPSSVEEDDEDDLEYCSSCGEDENTCEC